MQRYIISQFRNPHGWLGGLVGRIMAGRPSNRERNRWTLELLDLQPTDRVLEVGFGPGYAIQLAARVALQGSVVGVDHSHTMVQMAARRNARAIAEGRVQLHLADVADLPGAITPPAAHTHEAPPFDKAYAVNCIMFWPQPVEQLSRLRGLLRGDGLLAVTVQPRMKHLDEGGIADLARRLASQMAQAGFAEPRTTILPMRPQSAVCVVGRA